MRLWKIRFPKNSLIYYIVLIGTGQQKLNLIVNFYYLLDFWDNMMYFI